MPLLLVESSAPEPQPLLEESTCPRTLSGMIWMEKWIAEQSSGA